ncbi:glutaredoxin-related protein 5, mitochondrial [Bacillus rossius redtenbacheri]|uniref:glutaredoxin-related protein 5, mitochondrial n=1 Tax=Bacillus rossius redtenbacheri TaxID=93214 RepID=UPI002FDEE895
MSFIVRNVVTSLVHKSFSTQLKNVSVLYSTNNKVDIDALVKNNKVVVFMKGVPEEPKCGFSNAVVQILRMHGVKYDAHDVLKNDDLRQGIKTYSNWPTIPQVFIGGEFVGGCDILLQMHQNGELVEELEKAGIQSALLEKAIQEEEGKKSGEAK